MSLSNIVIENLRNLVYVSIQPHPSLNVIVGRNGSGKTTLLEAVYVLGRGKSFREHQMQNATNDNAELTRIVGSFPQPTLSGEAKSEKQRRIGIQWDRKGQRQIRIDGDTVRQSSRLAQALPLTYVGLEETRMLNGAPQSRRKFLDGAMFHVEHSFAENWARYDRTLRQRNSLLKERRGAVSLDALKVWDDRLGPLALEIDVQRKTYLATFLPQFQFYWRALMKRDAAPVDIQYERGWPSEAGDYSGFLKLRAKRDGERGFTQYGPHRADFTVLKSQRSLSTHGSAGEQKVAVCALYLAQWHIQREAKRTAPILLIDDVPAELDEERREDFLRLLLQLPGQKYISATEAELLTRSIFSTEPRDYAMFHVKHGKIGSA